jgi:sec-independent protein translocase protein TatB
MFDIGFSELLVIAIVALIVLGPERLPKATRFAGLWVRRARAQWYSVKDELERELAADELKRSLKDAQDALRDTEQRIRESASETERQFDEMRQAVRDDAKALRDDVASAVSPDAPDAPATEPAPTLTQQDAGDSPAAHAEAEPGSEPDPRAAAHPAIGTTPDLFSPKEARDESRSA